MDTPIEPIQPARSRLSTFVMPDSAVPMTVRPDPKPAQPVIGSADAQPHDTFEIQDPNTEFPSLDVITQRILSALHEALKEAAEKAALKSEEADLHAQKSEAATVEAKTPVDAKSAPHTSPKNDPVAEHFLGAADRIGRQGHGEVLLGEAKAALSQASHVDLSSVHALKSPARLFAS